MVLAITTYQWFLAFHILAATIWVGGALALDLIAHRADPKKDPARAAQYMEDAGFIGSRIFAPASITLVAFGFALMANGNLDYDGWVIWGIAVWALSFLVGVGYFGRVAGPLAQALATEGYTESVAARWKQFRMVGTIETILLLLTIADMALKPGA